MTWSSYDVSENLEENYVDSRLYMPPYTTGAGTACLLFGLGLAYSLYPAEATPAAMAGVVAVSVGIAFLISVYFDSRKGLYNLLRTDLLCLVGIYSLTLLEFLFPQTGFNDRVNLTQTANALNMVLLGMAGLSIGRHLVATKPTDSRWLNLKEISDSALFRTVLVCAFLGYFYMLMTVGFNPIRLIEGMLGPRFSEPWGRGQFGGWLTFLTELNLLTYAIPPLVGVIWNRRRSFSGFQMTVMLAILALVIFHGFSSGTRNIFISYLATFLMGYLITLPKYTLRNTILPILVSAFIALYGSYHMLAFRSMGLQNYISNQVYASESASDTLAVDYNLWSVGLLADAMPEVHDYLGFEVITWSLIKPIPRVLLPGKPIGLSVPPEEIVGAVGWTVAITYLGESYMMAGWLGILGMSLFLGALAAWWNRMAMRGQSDYALVVYSLGFFAAGITMRSLFWFTTAILPVIALIAYQKISTSTNS